MPVYFISRSYGKWSSGTQVDIDTEEYNSGVKQVNVYHPPTGEAFVVPRDILVAKRNREGGINDT